MKENVERYWEINRTSSTAQIDMNMITNMTRMKSFTIDKILTR